MPIESPENDRLLSWPLVKRITGLSRTTVWRLADRGDFPKAIRISPGRVAWSQKSITAWMDGKRHLEGQ